MQVGYKNDEVFKIMKEHITKYHKLLIFDPNDIHILL